MEKPDIIREQLKLGEDNCIINLLHPGHKRKEIYFVETEKQKMVIKFFKRNLLSLFQKEITFRGSKYISWAPQLLDFRIKLQHTKTNEKMQGDDFMFFVEEFIDGKTLMQVLQQSKNINEDIIFIDTAIEIYNRVFNDSYDNNFILKNANPNNIIFKDGNINNGYIIDLTEMKNITGISKELLQHKYDTMLFNNISKIQLKFKKNTLHTYL